MSPSSRLSKKVVQPNVEVLGRLNLANDPSVINVFTDCSGMEAPIQALQNLHIDFQHLAASDINDASRRFIKNNFAPKLLFRDLTKRRSTERALAQCGAQCSMIDTCRHLSAACESPSVQPTSAASLRKLVR